MVRPWRKRQDKVIPVTGLADTHTIDARRADDRHHLAAAGRDLFDLSRQALLGLALQWLHQQLSAGEQRSASADQGGPGCGH
jgi:hypothetical protein